MKKTTKFISGALAAFSVVVVVLSATADPGDIFVSVQLGGLIYKISPQGERSVFASGLQTPQGLAFDSAGNLFVADNGSHTIWKITPNRTITPFDTNVSSTGPWGLAFSSAGYLFVSNGENKIYKYAPDGTQTIFANLLSTPLGLAFDRAGFLFVVEKTGRRITKIAPDGTRNIFASGIFPSGGLAFDSEGNLFETDFLGYIKKFLPNGTQSNFSLGPPFSVGLAYGAGRLFVADPDSFLPVVWMYFPDGSRAEFSQIPEIPKWLTIQPPGPPGSTLLPHPTPPPRQSPPPRP